MSLHATDHVTSATGQEIAHAQTLPTVHQPRHPTVDNLTSTDDTASVGIGITIVGVVINHMVNT